jgi:hypothetical protein
MQSCTAIMSFLQTIPQNGDLLSYYQGFSGKAQLDHRRKWTQHVFAKFFELESSESVVKVLWLMEDVGF